ncbi:hypothetical protein [Rhizobium yanglingense]
MSATLEADRAASACARDADRPGRAALKSLTIRRAQIDLQSAIEHTLGSGRPACVAFAAVDIGNKRAGSIGSKDVKTLASDPGVWLAVPDQICSARAQSPPHVAASRRDPSAASSGSRPPNCRYPWTERRRDGNDDLRLR